MKKTIGLLFSGYGQQFVTMGKDLYDQSRDVQDLFEQASMCLDINFVQLCFASSAAEISEIDKGYLAILLLQVSFYSELAKAGLKPDFIAGYDIGEFSAAVASGSLSFADALYLLGKYARNFQAFLDGNPEYGVLSLPKGFTQESLQKLCDDLSTDGRKIFIAAHNGPTSFYVAGHKDVIDQLREYCKMHEIRKVKELSVAYGLHSSMVDPVVTMVSPYLHKVDFKALKFPVITNVDGVYVTSSDALESAIVRRINNPILFDEVLDGFIGCEVLIFVGPGQQIAEWAMVKYPDKQIFVIEKYADLEKVFKFLKAAQVKIDEEQAECAVEFGLCHLDDDTCPQLPEDLTLADEVNELASDYDIDEEDEE